jgi:hypothetical protein
MTKPELQAHIEERNREIEALQRSLRARRGRAGQKGAMRLAQLQHERDFMLHTILQAEAEHTRPL